MGSSPTTRSTSHCGTDPRARASNERDWLVMRRTGKSPSSNHGRLETLEPRRMFAAGALDPSFSFDGKATVNFGGAPAVAADVAVQADGKAVVAGTVTFTT